MSYDGVYGHEGPDPATSVSGNLLLGPGVTTLKTNKCMEGRSRVDREYQDSHGLDSRTAKEHYKI